MNVRVNNVGVVEFWIEQLLDSAILDLGECLRYLFTLNYIFRSNGYEKTRTTRRYENTRATRRFS